jgi:hypothetical protein
MRGVRPPNHVTGGAPVPAGPSACSKAVPALREDAHTSYFEPHAYPQGRDGLATAFSSRTHDTQRLPYMNSRSHPMRIESFRSPGIGGRRYGADFTRPSQISCFRHIRTLHCDGHLGNQRGQFRRCAGHASTCIVSHHETLPFIDTARDSGRGLAAGTGTRSPSAPSASPAAGGS